MADIGLAVVGLAIPVILQFIVGGMTAGAWLHLGPEPETPEIHWGVAAAPLIYAVPLILLSRHAPVPFRAGVITGCAVLFLLNLGCAGVLG